MDYAQARMQSRFGERPDAILWQRLDEAREPLAVIEIAGASGLARWVGGIEASSDSHAIEISLRARWRECVAETAAWMPARWQPAVRWTSRLIDLPALCRLAHGDAPYAWMSRDPVLRPYALADNSLRESMLREDGLDFASAHWAAAGAPSSDFEVLVRRAWREAWRRLWPSRCEAHALEDLAALIESRFAEPAAEAREEFVHNLRTRFRRATLRPTAAFAYLAFAALDIERLRAALLAGALLRRAGLAP